MFEGPALPLKVAPGAFVLNRPLQRRAGPHEQIFGRALRRQHMQKAWLQRNLDRRGAVQLAVQMKGLGSFRLNHDAAARKMQNIRPTEVSSRHNAQAVRQHLRRIASS